MAEIHSTSHFDIFILGGGQAGIPLAHHLAKAGKRVGLAERRYLGGSCVNFGCTPTKAAITSARLAHMARRSGDFGINCPIVEVDFPAVLARARNIAHDFRSGLEEGFGSARNPRLYYGHARLEGRVGGSRPSFRLSIAPRPGTPAADPHSSSDALLVTADQVVLNTGTRTLLPPIPGIEQTDFIHAGNWLDKTELPEHLAILGGGSIGLEMCQFYRRMGSRVTVLTQAERIAEHEDPEVSTAMQAFLEAEGIEFHCTTHLTQVESRRDQLTLHLEHAGQSREMSVSHLFLAIGRTPNTNDIGLESVGVRLTKNGIVEADERLSTSVPGIWAAGDIRGGPMFTHTSWDDNRILLSQIVGDHSRTTKRVVPYAYVTDPQLGRVGMSETEARAAGKNVRVLRFEMSHNGKAIEIGETTGFVKVVVDADNNRILGAAVLAAEGMELIHLFSDLMVQDAPYTVIRDAIYLHPSLCEGLQSAVTSD